MKKSFICYFDMDGVINLFDNDVNARINMWTPGYFLQLPVREGISEIMARINKESYVIIQTKVINRIGVAKEKMEWLNQNISPHAYSDIIFVPYDNSKSDYVRPYYPSMIIDNSEKNLDECSKKGCHGLFFSDTQISQKYPYAKTLEDIFTFYQRLIQRL